MCFFTSFMKLGGGKPPPNGDKGMHSLAKDGLVEVARQVDDSIFLCPVEAFGIHLDGG